MDLSEELTARELEKAQGLQDWRVVGRDALAWFAAGSHAAGAALLPGVLAHAGDGPAPEVDVRAQGVRVRLRRGGSRFTSHDVRAARAISAAAAGLGLSPDPSGLQLLQIGIDAADASTLLPFWEEVLGYERAGDVVLADPGRRLAPVWFQEQDAPRPLRNRLHLDAVTTHETATSTRARVTDLGGQVRHDQGFYATVADADGNEADILPLQPGADRWEDPGTEDWRLVFAAVAAYPTRSAEQAVALAQRVAALADEAGLPLGIDVRAGCTTLDSGKDRWEMEEGYVELAARCQAVARELGLAADPSRARFLQVGIDAVDIPGVRRFWAAALGYDEDPRENVTDLVHPHQLTMPVFLQRLDKDDMSAVRRAQRNRIHLDLFVPADEARARVDAALAAGGRITYDAEAPLWWTVADPEGNEICIAVSPGREEAWGE